jgi:glycosyltransferase involved in cell wall biosynthesis
MATDFPQIGLETFELSLERDRFARAGFTTSYGRVAEYIYRTLLFQAPEQWKMSLLVQRPWRQRPDETAAFARRGIKTDSFFMPPPLPLIQQSVGRRWRERLIRRDYIPRVQRRRFDLLHFTGQVPWGFRPLAPAEMYATMDFYMARFHPDLYSAELAQLKGRLDSLWLLCISSFTAADAVEFLGIAPERARAIPLAVDHTVYQPEPLEDDAALRSRYGLPERYVLYVGNFNSRKNVSTLARALERVNAGRAEPLPLVLAGYLGATQRRLRVRLNWEFARVLRRTPKHEVDQPTDQAMAAIYRGATLVVHPSRFEGFGFTVLEAAACGVPVVCGRHSALAEVGGDAARFLDDVLDVEEMQAAIQEVADSEGLRVGMRSRGLVHAAKFRWERFAQEVLAFHHEALRSTGVA